MTGKYVAGENGYFVHSRTCNRGRLLYSLTGTDLQSVVHAVGT